MSTWEERMSQRAAARASRVRDEERKADPHYPHGIYYEGNIVFCGCGEYRGCFSVVISEDWDGTIERHWMVEPSP